MEDSLADLNRIVKRSDQGMCGLLVLRKILIICPGHVSAMIFQDLVNTVKVPCIFLSGTYDVSLSFVDNRGSCNQKQPLLEKVTAEPWISWRKDGQGVSFCQLCPGYLP